MTKIDELKALDKPVLVPKDIAPLLGCTPYGITLQAREEPEKLGFPVCVIGTRTKIPKDAFIRWYEGLNTSKEENSDDETHT